MATTFPATILDASTTPGELVIQFPNDLPDQAPDYVRANVYGEDTEAAIPALTEALEAEGLTWADGQEPTDIAGPVVLTFL